MSEEKNKKNSYTCPDGHKIITVNHDAGVTPMFITCLTCGKPARSAMYLIDQSLLAGYEWYIPNDQEMRAEAEFYAKGHNMKTEDLLPGIKDHVSQGGLMIRKRFICGLVCDNYKVAKFEEEIKSRGLEFEKKPGPAAGTTSFRFAAPQTIGAEIANKIEGYYRNDKAKNN